MTAAQIEAAREAVYSAPMPSPGPVRRLACPTVERQHPDGPIRLPLWLDVIHQRRQHHATTTTTTPGPEASA